MTSIRKTLATLVMMATVLAGSALVSGAVSVAHAGGGSGPVEIIGHERPARGALAEFLISGTVTMTTLSRLSPWSTPSVIWPWPSYAAWHGCARFAVSSVSWLRSRGGG